MYQPFNFSPPPFSPPLTQTFLCVYFVELLDQHTEYEQICNADRDKKEQKKLAAIQVFSMTSLTSLL